MKTLVHLLFLSVSTLVIAFVVGCSKDQPEPRAQGPPKETSAQGAGVVAETLESQQSLRKPVTKDSSRAERSASDKAQNVETDQTSAQVQGDLDDASYTREQLPTWIDLAAEIGSRPQRAFQDCSELLEFYRAWGQAVARGEVDFSEVEETYEESVNVFSAGAGEMSSTGTNLRVSGVDEPDYIKRLGDYLYVLSPGRLHVLLVQGQLAPKQVAILDLPPGDFERRWIRDFDLLVLEDRAIVFYTTLGQPVQYHLNTYTRITRVFEIDIRRPSEPSIIQILQLPDTEYRGARLVDGRVRALFTTLKFPELNDIEDTTIEAWHPTYELLDSAQTIEHSGLAVPCRQVHLASGTSHGARSSYLMVFDPAGGIQHRHDVMLMANPMKISFSESSLYLLTTHQSGTEIHRFDLATGVPKYSTSLLVPRYVGGVGSMAEYDGTLRMWLRRWTGEKLIHRIEVIDLDDWSKTDSAMSSRWQDKSRELDADVDGVLFVDDLAFAIEIGRTNNSWHLIDLSGPGPLEIADTFHFPGEAVYLQPLDGKRVMLMGSNEPSRGGWTNRAALIDVSDPSEVVLLDDLDVGLERLAVLYEHRSFAIEGSTAWLSAGRHDHNSFQVIRIGVDTLQLESQVEVGRGFTTRAVVFNELVLVASRFASGIEIRSYLLEDNSLLGVQHIAWE